VMNAGINIYWFKIQALFIASSVAAFAGAMMTHVYHFVGMPVFASTTPFFRSPPP